VDAAVPVKRYANASGPKARPARAASPQPMALSQPFAGPVVQGLAAPVPVKFTGFGEALRAGEACIAVLVSAEAGDRVLCGWISEWVDHPHFVTSRSRAAFSHHAMPDVLLVCVSDKASVAQVLPACRKAWAGTAIMAVAASADPAERAQMLRLGADDVLHLAMPVREAAARVRAISLRARRYR